MVCKRLDIESITSRSLSVSRWVVASTSVIFWVSISVYPHSSPKSCLHIGQVVLRSNHFSMQWLQKEWLQSVTLVFSGSSSRQIEHTVSLLFCIGAHLSTSLRRRAILCSNTLSWFSTWVDTKSTASQGSINITSRRIVPGHIISWNKLSRASTILLHCVHVYITIFFVITKNVTQNKRFQFNASAKNPNWNG